jgi:hypothetical protein
MGNRIAKMVCISGALLLGFTLIAAGALADEIVLVNGDRLTGTVVKVEGGKLTLKTEYAGPIEIQADKIKSIMTDHPAEVHLVGGGSPEREDQNHRGGEAGRRTQPGAYGFNSGDE